MKRIRVMLRWSSEGFSNEVRVKRFDAISILSMGSFVITSPVYLRRIRDGKKTSLIYALKIRLEYLWNGVIPCYCFLGYVFWVNISSVG